LVGQRQGGQITEDGAIPGRASAWRASTVGHNHTEALIGQPLILAEGYAGRHDLLAVRPTVGAHQDREPTRTWYVIGGEEHRSADRILASLDDLYGWGHGRLLSVGLNEVLGIAATH
jgi:hypothetical protein